MMRDRRALTLIELLAGLGVVAILFALLLPAVQHVRESARRVQCQDNLRQTVLAVQMSHDGYRRIPSLYNGSYRYNNLDLSEPRNYWEELHFHSWQTAILPQLELSALYGRIDLSRAASDPSNQENANFESSVFVCPSASNPTQSVRVLAPDRVEGTAARTDYEAIGGVPISVDSEEVNGVSMHIYTHAAPGAWGLPRKALNGASDISYAGVEVTDFDDVRDGLSQTVMVGEIAGRPDVYSRGKLKQVHNNAGGRISRPAWAISGSYPGILLDRDTGVNQSNRGGIFSFHAGGANVAFADGSVRMIRESTDSKVVVAMATRAGGAAPQRARSPGTTPNRP